MKTKTLLVAVLCAVVTILCALLIFGCAEQSVVDSAADHSTKAVEQARKHMQTVAEVLDAAEPAIKETPAVNEALVAFREAYDSGENADALGHLRTAIDHAIKAGLEVPTEVPERMGQAELLLRLVDR